MSRDEVLHALYDLCVEVLGVDPERCGPDAMFGEDLGADSLDAAELVMEIEDRFGVAIPAEEDARLPFLRLRDAADLVLRALSPAQEDPL